MKFLSPLVGMALAAAAMLTLTSPAAFAAVTADQVPVFDLTAEEPSCLQSVDFDTNLVFVESTKNCDAMMAEVTGLCFELVSDRASLEAALGIRPFNVTCLHSRPSPPG